MGPTEPQRERQCGRAAGEAAGDQSVGRLRAEALSRPRARRQALGALYLGRDRGDEKGRAAGAPVERR